MVERSKFTSDQLRFAIEHGEFHDEVKASAPYVVCIMTQSWCPQWTFLRSGLNQLEENEEESKGMSIRTFEVEYDREQLFPEFRGFKEQVWNNWEVPYLRYYAEGKLIHESNFVSAMMLLDNLKQ